MDGQAILIVVLVLLAFLSGMEGIYLLMGQDLLGPHDAKNPHKHS